MDYKEALLALMKETGNTNTSLARELGITQAAVSASIVKNKMTVEVLQRYLRLRNAKIVIEWVDPKDGRKSRRWTID